MFVDVNIVLLECCHSIVLRIKICFDFILLFSIHFNYCKWFLHFLWNNSFKIRLPKGNMNHKMHFHSNWKLVCWKVEWWLIDQEVDSLTFLRDSFVFICFEKNQTWFSSWCLVILILFINILSLCFSKIKLKLNVYKSCYWICSLRDFMILGRPCISKGRCKTWFTNKNVYWIDICIIIFLTNSFTHKRFDQLSRW